MANVSATTGAVDTSSFDTFNLNNGDVLSTSNSSIVYELFDGTIATFTGSFIRDFNGEVIDGTITGYEEDNGFEITNLSYDVPTFIDDLFNEDDFLIAETAFRFSDRIFGSTQSDILFGYDGNDTISGRGGSDIIVGGRGGDLLFGGGGNDTILGLGNNDIIDGNSGNDRIIGGGGIDSLFGSSGNDFINGNFFGDELDGGDGRDTLVGAEGNDELVGGRGLDILNGTRNGLNGVGERDTLTGGRGTQDRFVLGSRTDSYYLDSGSGNTSFARIQDFESLDRFILHGSRSDYRLTESGGDTFLSYRESGPDDRIALIRNTVGLNLNSVQFIYL